ncbi:hypothetical protein IAU60_003182 [Kwoniella sp. DSM 27419]
MQQIERKLSFRSATSPKKKVGAGWGLWLTGGRSTPPHAYHPTSGNESDSSTSSVLNLGSTSPMLTPATTGGLSAIAERQSADLFDDMDLEDVEEEESASEDEELQVGMEGERVVKSGYLVKKQERRKRWFVLRTGKLAYYKDDKVGSGCLRIADLEEYSLKRVLDLRDVHTVAPVAVKKHPNAFGIVTPKRTFFAKAAHPDEMDEWVRAINGARRRISEVQEEASVPGGSTPSSAGGYFARPVARGSLATSPMDTTHSLTAQMARVSVRPQAVTSRSVREPSASSISDRLEPGPSSDEEDEGEEAPPLDPNKVILSAYLMKQSGRRRWRKRWFVLTSQGMTYTKSHMRSVPLSSVLDALEVDAESDSDHATAQDSNTFRLITAKRTFVLCAPSEEDEIKWLAAFRALLNQARQPAQAQAAQGAAGVSQVGTGERAGERPEREVPMTRGRSATYMAKTAVADAVKRFQE